MAATMMAGPLVLAASPAVTAAPEVEAPPALARADLSTGFESSALLSRDETVASRGRTRPAPTPAPEPSAAPPPAPAAPAPAAPAPAAPAPVAPAPAPVAPAAPPAVTGEEWATKDVNVRSGPTVDTERVGYLAAGEPVGVSGTTADGWTQVVLDGTVGWVNGSYLSATEPAPEPAPAPEAASSRSSEPAPAVSDASCSIDPGMESNLNGNARAVYRAVCAAHGGSVSAFGGYRPGDGGDHGSGRAVDIMVSGPRGWDIARFVQARAGELGVTYVIYEQQIWMAGSPAGAWEYMEDRGGATANHFDHVHVSVD